MDLEQFTELAAYAAERGFVLGITEVSELGIPHATVVARRISTGGTHRLLDPTPSKEWTVSLPATTTAAQRIGAVLCVVSEFTPAAAAIRFSWGASTAFTKKDIDIGIALIEKAEAAQAEAAAAIAMSLEEVDESDSESEI